MYRDCVNRLREICPEFPGPAEVIHWSIPDPAAGGGGYPAFQAVAADLRARSGFLLARISEEKRLGGQQILLEDPAGDMGALSRPVGG